MVSQQQSLSLLLILLLKELELANIGYKFNEIDIPGISFVDDLKIISDNKENIIHLFKILVAFCKHFKISINVNKSAYTTKQGR